MKHFKKALCLLMCVCIAFGNTHSGFKVYAALTNDKIKEKEAEIAEAKKEITSLKSGLTDVTAVKKELEKSKKNLEAYITELDNQLGDIQEKIAQYNTLIEEKTQEIELTSKELDAAIEQQETQYEAMKKRIKFMYEKGDSYYLELLVSSAGLSDLTNKADYIEALSAYDRNKLDEYVQTTELITLCKEQLETEKEMLSETKAAVEQEEQSVSELIGEKEKQIVAVESDISSQEAAIKEYEEMIAQQNAEIKELERIVAEERARLEAENAVARVYNGGMFAWPCPGYTRISDEYGNRIHPILKTQQFHNGLDMAAPGGTAILAAYDGDVVAAAYSGTMGNYVMIDHGSSLYTIYMHCSSLNVSKGQTVVKGQKIAAVGSTGRSTGNHLHFSVRLNGGYVNPWNYLK